VLFQKSSLDLHCFFKSIPQITLKVPIRQANRFGPGDPGSHPFYTCCWNQRIFFRNEDKDRTRYLVCLGNRSVKT